MIERDADILIPGEMALPLLRKSQVPDVILMDAIDDGDPHFGEHCFCKSLQMAHGKLQASARSFRIKRRGILKQAGLIPSSVFCFFNCCSNAFGRSELFRRTRSFKDLPDV